MLRSLYQVFPALFVLVLPGLVAASDAGPSLRFDPQKAARQKSHDDAEACFVALGVAHNAAFLTSLAAPFPVDLAADFTAHVANLTLKACPPALHPPADLAIDIPIGECQARRTQSRLLERHENVFGVPVPRDGNWGELGTPTSFHWNTDVDVAGSHPFATEILSGELILPVGAHEIIWEGHTLVSPLDNLFIYVPGLPKGLVKKLGKRGLKVADVLLDVAVEAALVAADLTLDGFLRPLPSGALSRQIQNVVVRDVEPPVFENITRSDFVFEAVEPGGTSFEAIDFSGRVNGEVLREAFTVRDPCDRPVELTSARGFWPVGATTTHIWTALDPGPNASGERNETVLEQNITVQDTLAPVLVAPDAIVVETSSASALVNPGTPQVFDLGDVDPMISNDGGTPDTQGRLSFPLGVNTLSWRATDASGNLASAPQIVNVKTLGSNRPPVAQAQGVDARTFEFSEIILAASDPDADPLSYRIDDWPDNGFFEAPLYPYFIEDFRLPQGTSCTANRAPELVEKPDFVQTTDAGITYVLNRELANPCATPRPGGRVSMFDADGNFLLGRDMPPSADLNGLQIDQARNEVLYTTFNTGTFRPEFYVLDGTDLSTRALYTTAESQSSIQSVVIDDADILYASTGTSKVTVYDLREATLDSGVRILPAPVGELNVCHPAQSTCSNSTFASRDLLVAPDGGLLVSTEFRIYRFEPSRRDADGNVELAGEARWMGACGGGEGCDAAKRVSRGFSCVSDGTCLDDFNQPRDGEGQFNQIFGLALDPNGILYAADFNNRRVQRFTPEGFYAGQARNDCPAGQRCFVLGDFDFPRAISVNARQLLVVDFTLALVHVFQTSVIDPQNDGTATVNYRSVEGFQGEDRFDFVASDGLADSPPATVTVAVARNFRPPLAIAGVTARGPEDSVIPVPLFGSDPDGSLDTLSYEIVEPPTLGTLSGTGRERSYTPPVNFEGEVSFSFRVFDGLAYSAAADYRIVVEPVNDPPQLAFVSAGVAEQRGVTPAVTVPIGYPVDFRLRYSDSDAVDQHSVQVAWGGLEPTQDEDTDLGDGSVDGPVLIADPDGGGEVVALYSYGRGGTRDARFCLTDNIMVVNGVKTPTDTSLTTCQPVSVTAVPMADVQARIIAPPVIAAQQNTLTVDIEVSNGQPDGDALGATGVTLEVALDGAAQFLSFAPNAAASCVDTATSRGCNLDDLAPGETITLRQVLDIDGAALPGDSLTLTAEARANEPDPRLPNRQSLEIVIGPAADVLVTQEADETTACALLCPDQVAACPPPGQPVPSCSLRSALALADDTPGEQTILLGDGVFEIASAPGPWTVGNDLRLLGLGAGRSRLSGALSQRVLQMTAGATLQLEDLSIVNGLVEIGPGGGIAMAGTSELILRRVHLQGNSARDAGGGIHNPGGRLELWDSTVDDNESTGDLGGGVYSDGPTRIVNSTFSGNRAFLVGGGLMVDFNGSLSLEFSTITANQSLQRGTGLTLFANNPATLYQSVISANGTPGDGLADCYDLDGFAVSLGHNYVEADCLGTPALSDRIGDSPQPDDPDDLYLTPHPDPLPPPSRT